MPYTYNGIGTWYRFSKNHQSYHGVCRACGRNATLTSYDTTLCFVVLFVPVIPLGKKRIIDECSVCRRHAVMPHAQWRVAQERINSTVAAYRAAPTDSVLAREALIAVLGLRDLTTFHVLADQIATSLAGDAKMLLMLAEASQMLGQYEKIEGLLRSAVAVDTTDESKEALARFLVTQGRPDEAIPYLEHVITQGIPDRVDLIYHLAQVYQAMGQHEKAIQAFQDCERIHPAISSDTKFLKLKAASEKRLGTQKKVPFGELERKEKRARSINKFAVAAGGALLVGGIGYLGLAAARGFSRDVYLVNSLGREYTVKINDISHRLAARSTRRISVAEGNIRVEIADAPPGVEPRTVTLRTPFFSRPFDSRTFVINPDEAGLLRVVRSYYGADKNTLPEPELLSAVAGECLASFPDLDLVFDPFPTSIKADKRSDIISRTRLEVAAIEQPAMENYALLAAIPKAGSEKVTHAVRRHLQLEPQRDDLLDIASNVISADELVQLLRPRLGDRPVLVELHREYQSAMSKLGRDEEMEKDYAKLLAAEPGDSALMYLAGRAAGNPYDSKALYLKAANSGNPPIQVFYSLAYLARANGEHAEAAAWAARLSAGAGDNRVLRLYARETMMVAGEWRKVIEMAKQDRNGELPHRLSALSDEATANLMLGDPVEANLLLSQGRAILRSYGGQEYEHWFRRQQAEHDYMLGNIASLIPWLKGDKSSSALVTAALIEKDVVAADRELGDSVSPDAHLLVYILAKTKGQSELARKHWNLAAEAFSKGRRDHRMAAKILRGDRSDLELLMVDSLDGSEKCLLLTALALEDRSLAPKVVPLARRLNSLRSFPYLLVNDALNEAEGKAR